MEQQSTFYLKSVRYPERPASQLMDESCHLYHTCRIVSFMVCFLSTLSGQGEINSQYCYHSKYFPPSPAQFLPACLPRVFHITSHFNKNDQPTGPIDFAVEPEPVFVLGCLSRSNPPKIDSLFHCDQSVEKI